MHLIRQRGAAAIVVCCLALALWVGFLPRIARAVQNELVPPTSGIYSGVQYSQKIGDAFRSLASCNKGPSAPANVSGSAVDGLCWIDDSASPWIIKQYVNGAWAVVGALDPSTSGFVGVVAGGTPASIDSATGPVINLGSVPQANVTITGTSGITGFGAGAPIGVVKFIRFAAALTLTNSAALAVPGGYDLTTGAGDRAIVTNLGSGNWEITQYTRASGIPIDVSAVGKPSFDFGVSVPPLHVAAYGQGISRTAYPAYLAATTRTQNGILASGNATITGLADTSGFGAGMPVEAPAGIVNGCTIVSKTANSITLNSGTCVTLSVTEPVTVFVYGYGAGKTALSGTVGVPDCRGRSLSGRDRSDPGALANLLTASYFGVDSSVFGASGGRESQTLDITQLPGIASSGVNAITLSGTSTETQVDTGANAIGIQGGATTIHYQNTNQQIHVTVSGSPNISVTSVGTMGLPHPIVQPTLIAECVVRVTP